MVLLNLSFYSPSAQCSVFRHRLTDSDNNTKWYSFEWSFTQPFYLLWNGFYHQYLYWVESINEQDTGRLCVAKSSDSGSKTLLMHSKMSWRIYLFFGIWDLGLQTWNKLSFVMHSQFTYSSVLTIPSISVRPYRLVRSTFTLSLWFGVRIDSGI